MSSDSNNYTRREFIHGGVTAAAATYLMLSDAFHTVPAWAQSNDQNVLIMKRLYTTIANTMILPDSISDVHSPFLILANPGYIIDPNLDMRKPANQQRFSRFLDNIPYPRWIYQPTSVQVPDVWRRILEDKDFPRMNLSDAQKAQLEAAYSVLRTSEGDATVKLTKYKKFRRAYDTARMAYQSAAQRALADGNNIDPSIITALTEAESDWIVQGYKYEIERAQADIFNLQSGDPSQWWSKMHNDYDLNKAANNGMVVSGTDPERSTWSLLEGWTEYSFTHSESASTEYSASTRVGGGLGGFWGLWRGNLGANYSTNQGHSTSQSSDVSITAKLTRVRIDRPWMDGTVFRSRNWRWKEGTDSHGTPVSNGADTTAGQTPAGYMPVLPVGLLLAKDVSMTGNFSASDSSFIDTHIQENHALGWGPFSFGGHYERDEHSGQSHGSRSGNTISFDDMQIIGWFCDVLPECPAPERVLPWTRPIEIGDYPALSDNFVGRLRRRETNPRLSILGNQSLAEMRRRGRL